MNNRSNLSKKTKTLFGIGTYGYSSLNQTLSSFIMFFGISIIKIRPFLVGIAIAISTFWDGVSDPIVGFISDNHKSKFFGKRHGFLLFATFGIVITNILIWNIPSSLSEASKFFILVILMLLIETFNTFFSTPYGALAIDLSEFDTNHNSIQVFRTIFYILALITPNVLMMIFMKPTPEFPNGQLNPESYKNISYITSILTVVCAIIMIIGTINKGRESYKLTENNPKEKFNFVNLFKGFFSVFAKRDFRNVIMGYSVAIMSTSFLSGLGMHLFTYTFHLSTIQIPFVLGFLFLSAMISQPFWNYISVKKSKVKAIKYALLTAMIGVVLLAISLKLNQIYDNVYLFLCITFFISGFGTGALYCLPFALYSDIVLEDKNKTGIDKTATYNAYMTMAFKIANALTLLVNGILLSLIKFDADKPVQPLSVQRSLGVIVLVGVSFSVLTAYSIFNNFENNRKVSGLFFKKLKKVKK